MSTAKLHKKVIPNIPGFSKVVKIRHPILGSKKRTLKFHIQDPELVRAKIKSDRAISPIQRIGRHIAHAVRTSFGDIRFDYTINTHGKHAEAEFFIDKRIDSIKAREAMAVFLQRMKRKGVKTLRTSFGYNEIELLSRFNFKVVSQGENNHTNLSYAKIDLSKLSPEDISTLARVGKPDKLEMKKMIHDLGIMRVIFPPH